jgi:pimeloyl-ACP methyl ester carboxylesterase
MSLLRRAFILLLGSASADIPLNFAFPKKTTHPTPFQVSVDSAFIKDTVQKARLYRPSIALQDQADWVDGPPPDQINDLARFWAKDYDWYKVQQEINANFSHFTTTGPGSGKYQHPVPLHFVHERASVCNETKEAIPLLLLHGWPSTHLEWSKVIHPLAHPSNASLPCFHVVAPDMPGFGFSPAPTHSGFGFREAAQTFDALMKQLGYPKYSIFSTDLGWLVGMWMAADTTSVTAHMTDFFAVAPNATDIERLARNETTAEETAYMLASGEYQNNHFAYALVHGHRSLSVALAMTDSPVGFLGWVWQVMNAASAGYAYSKADLITTTMMLYIQGTYGGMLLYKDSMVANLPSAAFIVLLC